MKLKDWRIANFGPEADQAVRRDQDARRDGLSVPNSRAV
jgi:hypothetical protein